MRNRNDIHKWCFFIIPDTTVSCCLKHSMKFYSGKYSCGRKLQFEFYDSEGIMCSIICSESAPSNHSEKIDLPLSICLYELKEIGCSRLYSLYYSEKKTVNVNMMILTTRMKQMENLTSKRCTLTLSQFLY